MKNWTIFTSDSIFSFGKHEGFTLEQVAKENSQYILWCVLNIPKFLITEADFQEYSEKYPITLPGVDAQTGELVECRFNCFTYSESDLQHLRNKWEAYEEYVDLQSEADYSCYDDYSVDSNPYYNDNLDMDQQDPEFWDWF
jgi:hypothetical protein